MSSEIGPLDPRVDTWPELSDRVVVVFGGVTSRGDSRARERVREAFENDCDVVWFDGMERKHLGLTNRRDAVKENSEHRVVVIGYQADERALFVNRLPNASRFIISRLEKTLFGRLPGVAILLGLFEAAWRTVARPASLVVAKASRGFFAWRLLESRIRAVAARVPKPECVVYTDDYSLPLAWNAAQSIWRDCPAGGNVVSRQMGVPR